MVGRNTFTRVLQKYTDYNGILCIHDVSGMDNEYSSVQFGTNNKRLTLITRVISRLFNTKLIAPKLYYFAMRKY